LIPAEFLNKLSGGMEKKQTFLFSSLTRLTNKSVGRHDRLKIRSTISSYKFYHTCACLTDISHSLFYYIHHFLLPLSFEPCQQLYYSTLTPVSGWL